MQTTNFHLRNHTMKINLDVSVNLEDESGNAVNLFMSDDQKIELAKALFADVHAKDKPLSLVEGGKAS